MQKSYLNLLRGIFILLTLVIQNLPIYSQNPAPEPLQQCWEFNTEQVSKAQIASDNTSHIYLSYKDGQLVSVNLADGTSEWTTELGGQTAEILYDKNTLYVISINKNKENSQTDSAGSIVIRSVSAETGVVKWQQQLETVQTAADGENSLVSAGEYLFLATSIGNLYKFSKSAGQQLEKVELGAAVTTAADVSDNDIYVGTDQKLLNVYSITDKTVKKIPLKDVPTAIYLDENRIIVGDKLGKLTALNSKGDQEWQTRTGAEIGNITKTLRGLAVSSNDNFIYFVSAKNGAKLWKKRLNGRTTAVNSETDNTLLIVDLNGDLSTLVETDKGKTINQVTIQSPRFFINKPILLNNMIVFHTNTGLVAYTSSAQSCQKEKKIGE